MRKNIFNRPLPVIRQDNQGALIQAAVGTTRPNVYSAQEFAVNVIDAIKARIKRETK